MTPVIDDEDTLALIARLAGLRGIDMEEAVRMAIRAELDRADAEPLVERLKRFWAEHPMPPPTGEVADKAFFDELSGDL